MTQRVTGIGGVFFKARGDAAALREGGVGDEVQQQLVEAAAAGDGFRRSGRGSTTFPSSGDRRSAS